MCESKTEVSTPFWASNSNGKVMTVLWRMIMMILMIMILMMIIMIMILSRFAPFSTTKSSSKLSTRKYARKQPT